MASDGTAARNLVDLGEDCLVAILRQCRIPDILRFSECSHSSWSSAGDNQIWKPLFTARRWAGAAHGAEHERAGAWRTAYRMAARAESPIVIEISELRCIAGFARDGEPTAVRLRRRNFDDVRDVVDAAVCAIGLASADEGTGLSTGDRPLEGADCILVVGVNDGAADVAPVLAHLFHRGARRIRLAEPAIAALRCCGGLRTGLVLFFDYDTVAAACVMDGVRLPPRRRGLTCGGLRCAIEHLVATAAVPPRPGAASAAAAAGSAGGGLSRPGVVAHGGVVGSEAAMGHAELTFAATCAMAGGDYSKPIGGSVVPPMTGGTGGTVAAAAAARNTPVSGVAGNDGSHGGSGAGSVRSGGSAQGQTTSAVVVARLSETTGKPVSWCEVALQRHHGNADAAALWLLSGDAEEEYATAAAIAATAAAATATATAAAPGAAVPTAVPTAVPGTAPTAAATAVAATSTSASASADASGNSGGTGDGGEAAGASSVRRPGPLSMGCQEAGADMAWLLQRHCYVRAVSVERRPVSGEESAMAKSVIKAPSGRKWTLAEHRFQALEQMFRQPPGEGGAGAAGCLGVPMSAARTPYASMIFTGGVAGVTGSGTGGGVLADGGDDDDDGPRIVEIFPGTETAADATQPQRPFDGSVQGGGAGGGMPGAAGGVQRVAGSGLAAALALGSGSGALREPGGKGRAMEGVIDVLKTTIESVASRERMGELYGAVLLAGCGGSLPGMRQRLDSELRQIRNDPSMPRAVRPRLVEMPSANSGSVEARVMSLGARGSEAKERAAAGGDGTAGGGGGGGGGGGIRTASAGLSADGLGEDFLREAAWALTEAETLAWRGAAEEALAQARGVRASAPHSSASRDAGEWMVADQFRRNPHYATRAAFKAAGCVNMESVVDRGANGLVTDRWGAVDRWGGAPSALRGGPMLRN
jgi:hypothetical protein